MKRGKLTVVLLFLAAMLFANGEQDAASGGSGEMPRNETLYLNGLQWGAPTGFNPLAPTPTFPVGPDVVLDNSHLIYETLFLFNELTNEMEPLLGESYEWVGNDSISVRINPDAHFNDGTALTAEDVVYSFLLGEKYAVPWSKYLLYIDDAHVEDGGVVFDLSQENYNRLAALDGLVNVPIIPKHIWEGIETETGGKIGDMRNRFNQNPVGSGPYVLYFFDDTKVALIRDDNYWGKALFGKLPAPKYIVHNIFKSNDAGNNAFRNGEVDISQQFIPKVWKLWEGGEPYKTYLDDFPYYRPGLTPMIIFNMTKEGIDVPEVRKALALSIDYKKIADVAMSGYSASIQPGITLNTPEENRNLDLNATKNLLWTTDVDKANALLDSIGALPGEDGVRVLKDGITRLGPWNLECPYGWTDWNASLEIVAQSAKKIGIELRTKFPEAPVFYNDFYTGNFDITMWNTTLPSVSQPWSRAQFMMDDTELPGIGDNATYNMGRFHNARATELINRIPQISDPEELKALYTELNKIYLENIPTIQLMYRPARFYTVYEGVWKGLPDSRNNPDNIPPSPVGGAFVKILYSISPK